MKMNSDRTTRSFEEDISGIENSIAMSGYVLADKEERFALINELTEELEVLKSVLQQ